jgi:hypothetical protein
MANWTDIPDDVFDVDEPVVGATHLAILKNITALAEGAAGAPRINGKAIQYALPVTATLASQVVLKPSQSYERDFEIMTYTPTRIYGNMRVYGNTYDGICRIYVNGTIVHEANANGYTNVVVSVPVGSTLTATCSGVGYYDLGVFADDNIVERVPIAYASELD